MPSSHCFYWLAKNHFYGVNFQLNKLKLSIGMKCHELKLNYFSEQGESFEITLCIIRAAHLQTEKYAFTKILFHYFNGVLNLFCLCLYFLYWLLSSLAKNQRKIAIDVISTRCKFFIVKRVYYLPPSCLKHHLSKALW